MAEDKANNLHPKYDALSRLRVLTCDVRGGTSKLRDKKTTYLPMYPGESQSEYDARLKSSTAFNMLAKTEAVVAGLVFEGEIDVSKVHSRIQPLLDNIDNRGNNFSVFARDVFQRAMDGCCIIFADSPPTKANDAGEEKALGLRPYLVAYDANCAVNWRWQVNAVSKRLELALLVLKEVSAEPAGRFVTKDVTRYRVLYLDQGIVRWELWRAKDGDGKELEPVPEDQGVFNGFTEIPVAIVGDLEAEPKLLDVAHLVIKHYQKESSFDIIEYLSVPTFYTKGYEGEDALHLGAASHVKLPIDGEVGFAQIDSAGHDSLKDSLTKIQQQIRILGSSVLADKTAQVEVTATETVLDNVAETAEIRVWSEQLKDALERALQFMGQYAGLGEDQAGTIELGTAWALAEKKAIEDRELKLKGEQAMIAATAAKANE